MLWPQERRRQMAQAQHRLLGEGKDPLEERNNERLERDINQMQQASPITEPIVARCSAPPLALERVTAHGRGTIGHAPLNFAPKGKRRKRTRRPNRRSIKIHRAYTVEAAARVTGCAKGTIRRWIKSGALPAIIEQKPHLILGGDLYDYLKARAMSGPKLQLHECYCFRCRAPRAPALNMAEYLPLTATTGNLRALCGTCTTVMHKAIPLAALAALAGILEVTVRQATKHLRDTANPSLNDHLGKELKTNA